MKQLVSLVVALVGTGFASVVSAAQPSPQDLKRLSIEELMQINVTLATRRPEPIATTPAAISVITGDDIRRAGVTTVGDAIALADGVHVARFNSGTWSISARGFNAVTANKMLVMIDGRTVYSPLFTGVFWNAIDYVLEDIDRIEVIRGPGATLWGANAVNGIVNIITRSSRDTAGAYVHVGAGNEDSAIVEARFGRAAQSASVRAYAKYVKRDGQRFSDGSDALDDRARAQAGFRADGGNAGTSTWLIKGDLFHSTDRFPDRADGEFTVGDLQAGWTHALSPRSELQLRSYFNHEFRRIPLQLTHRLSTVDVDAQHSLTLTRHGVVWGGGGRINHDSTEGTALLFFEPRSRTYPVANVFVQDDVAVVPQRVYLTAGIKYERNAFSGGAWQPNLRARWLLPSQQMLWGSVARAVRRPTRFDDDIVIAAPTGAVLVQGSDDFESETLVATEVGYRLQPVSFFSAEATVFVHHYDRLRSQEAQRGVVPIPLIVGNSLNGRSQGIELAANVQPVRRWRTHVTYTRLDVEVTRDPDSRDVGGGTTEANDPPYLFGIRSSVDLPRNVDVDVRMRSVGRLPNPRVSAYSEMTFRVAWRMTPHAEVAFEGEDVLHDRHGEFNPVARGLEQFERSLRAVLVTRF